MESDSSISFMESLMADLEVIAEAQGFLVHRTRSGWVFRKGAIFLPTGLPKRPVDLWRIVADLQRMGLKLPDRE